MLRIGLTGGMSWESTAEYYRLLNEVVRDRLGGLHSADLLVVSVDFADIERLQVEGRWDEAGLVLAEHARRLESAGAELLVLCTNTMHKVAERIEAAVSIPFLHLGDATATAVRRAGITTVGLLGTAFTMEQDFYRDRPATHGLTVLVPDPHDRAEVHRVIYEELVLGVVRAESRATYRAVMDRLVTAGAEGIILAAPRSSCWSVRTTATSLFSRPPGSTSRQRSTPRCPHPSCTRSAEKAPSDRPRELYASRPDIHFGERLAMEVRPRPP